MAHQPRRRNSLYATNQNANTNGPSAIGRRKSSNVGTSPTVEPIPIISQGRLIQNANHRISRRYPDASSGCAHIRTDAPPDKGDVDERAGEQWHPAIPCKEHRRGPLDKNVIMTHRREDASGKATTGPLWLPSSSRAAPTGSPLPDAALGPERTRSPRFLSRLQAGGVIADLRGWHSFGDCQLSRGRVKSHLHAQRLGCTRIAEAASGRVRPTGLPLSRI